MTAATATGETGGATRAGAALRPLLRFAIPVLLLVLAWFYLGPQQFVNALTRGSIYALIALGYTMVYGIIELINFAHGDMFTVGAFVSLSFLVFLGFSGAITDVGLLIIVLAATFLVTMGAMGAIGVTIERLAYKPLRRAPRLAPLITAIGVSFILQNVIQLFYGPFQTNSPKVFPDSWSVQIGGATIPVLSVFIVGVALSLMVGLQLFIGRTRLGRSMRATAADRDAAALMGVNINRTIAITFLIGSALAGAAGVINGLQYGVARFDDGFQAGLKAFTAAVLGGIGNTVGAALGGFIIGFIEVAAVVAGYGRWGPAIVFGTLVIVLVFRPSGLLGQQLGERA
ncbi:MAG TPA: branched-chain amino acid ABC transporter permease [Candidatus Limnocylindrales bacterium]|nr:branched-chain amino acid ABC transporter permease [Candidatus Limnocylindrales bacterium]